MSTNGDRGAKVRPLILDLSVPTYQEVSALRQVLVNDLNDNKESISHSKKEYPAGASKDDDNKNYSNNKFKKQDD